MKKAIALLIGHDAARQGAHCRTLDRTEHSIATELFNYCIKVLMDSQVPVLACGGLLGDKIDFCNERSDLIEIAIELHCNSHESEFASGVECLAYHNIGVASCYGSKICRAISVGLGKVNRGIKVRKDLRFLRKTYNQSLIVEPFFLSNPAECKFYKDRLSILGEVIGLSIANTYLELNK